jgi:NitT/TauT family transport system permease protein
VEADEPAAAVKTSAAPTPQPSRRVRAARAAVAAVRRWSKPLVALALAIVGWGLYVEISGIESFVLPSPTSVAGYLVHHEELLWTNATITLREVAIAFALCLGLGVLLAVLISWFRLLEDALLPLLVVSQVVPIIAIAPLLVIWLGFGDKPKIAVAVLIGFFPIVINTLNGLQSVNPELIEMVQGLSASRSQILRKLSFPHALPHLFAGIRVSITLVVIGAVVGEFVGADQGLGFMILRGSAELNSPQMFGAIIFLAAMGIVLFNLVRLLERVVIPWQERPVT